MITPSGHTSHNDRLAVVQVDFDWDDHFGMTRIIDTQDLAFDDLGTAKSPGLRTLLVSMNIKVVAKHHSGNDSAYQTDVRVTAVLDQAKRDGGLPMADNSKADIGAAADAVRTTDYEVTSCEFISGSNACEMLLNG